MLLRSSEAPAVDVDLLARAVRQDPYPTYARLRREAPVATSSYFFGGRLWLLSRYQDVHDALRDPRLASDQRTTKTGKSDFDRWWLPKIMQAFQDSMVMQDGESHRRLRNLVHKAFAPRMIESMAGRMERIVDELLTKAKARGTVDLIADFALPLPLTIICEMMGVPEEDRQSFHDWMSRIIGGGEFSLSGFLRQVPSMLQMARFLRRLVQRRRADPRDDLTTALIQARDQGDQLSDDELTAMLFLLLLAGHETTVNLIGNGTLALLDTPAELALLRERPSIIGTAVEELLRFANPVEQPSPRFAREDITLHGRTIPRGERVIALIASANRDEEAFERAGELDLTRDPNRHVAFGVGVHYCLGAPLARLEGQIALSALVQRFPRIRLAVPRSQIEWRPSPAIHGLKALPVHLS